MDPRAGGWEADDEGVWYSMKRFALTLAVLSTVLSLAGCSESGKPPVVDATGPEVLVFYPPADVDVSDSTNIYVGAIDRGADQSEGTVSSVVFLFARPDSPERDTIGVVTTPISLEQVPDSVRPFIELEEGWSLYTRRWYTGPKYPEPVGTPINSGTMVKLFAVAVDPAGNPGRSEEREIRILNVGDDLGPPRPDFVITPNSGTQSTDFEFDPGPTEDDLDPPERISVRWDFDGDGVWDIDWAAGANAGQVQRHTYRAPRNYTAVLEAHNSYLRDVIVSQPRQLTVLPDGGEPDPPERENFVEIPAGTYSVGDSTYVLDGNTVQTENDERPVHQVVLSQPFMIEKTEVTNRLYLNYLNEALLADSGGVIYEPSTQTIRTRYTNRVCMKLSESKIFFNLDTNRFQITPGFDEHPVTGASWYGAEAYANKYSCRLPTEAEWEVAARGGHPEYNFPFATPSDTRDIKFLANYLASGDPFEGSSRTTPRGFYNGQVFGGFETRDAVSAFGLYDMAGNVAEWTNDWFGPYPSNAVLDPQGPLDGTFKVVRGGSYLSTRTGIRATSRAGATPPDESFPSIGFRTAFSLFPGN